MGSHITLPFYGKGVKVVLHEEHGMRNTVAAMFGKGCLPHGKSSTFKSSAIHTTGHLNRRLAEL